MLSFAEFCPVSEAESVGFFLDSSVCALVVRLSMLVVTVLIMNANLVWEVVFSDSDCEVVEPHVEGQKKNFDGALVKAPPATRRKATPHGAANMPGFNVAGRKRRCWKSVVSQRFWTFCCGTSAMSVSFVPLSTRSRLCDVTR